MDSLQYDALRKMFENRRLLPWIPEHALFIKGELAKLAVIDKEAAGSFELFYNARMKEYELAQKEYERSQEELVQPKGDLADFIESVKAGAAEKAKEEQKAKPKKAKK